MQFGMDSRGRAQVALIDGIAGIDESAPAIRELARAQDPAAFVAYGLTRAARNLLVQANQALSGQTRAA